MNTFRAFWGQAFISWSQNEATSWLLVSRFGTPLPYKTAVCEQLDISVSLQKSVLNL